MTIKSTEGPWVARLLDEEDVGIPTVGIIKDSEEYVDDDSSKWPNGGFDVAHCYGPEKEGNAALIVSAHGMLTALQRLTLAAERREYTMGDACNLIAVKAELADAARQARAAIARSAGSRS